MLGDHGGHVATIDPTLEVHRIGTGGHVFDAGVDDGLSQHGGGRGSVAGHVAGLGGDLLDHLRADVLDLAFQLDFLGHGDAVLRDGRGAVALLDDDVATLRTERHLDGIGKCIHAALERAPCIGVEYDLFGHDSSVIRLIAFWRLDMSPRPFGYGPGTIFGTFRSGFLAASAAHCTFRGASSMLLASAYSITPRMSLSRRISTSSPSSVISVPAYFP